MKRVLIKNLNVILAIFITLFIALLFCEETMQYYLKNDFNLIYIIFVLWLIYRLIENKSQLKQTKIAYKKNKEVLDNILSHDFKNPVIAQIKALELLISGKFGTMKDYQLEILKQTLYSSKLVEEMLNSLISISNLELSSYQFILEKCNLKKIVNNFLNKFENIAKNKNVKIKLNFDKRINYNIKADKSLIERAIINLILNAIYCSNENSVVNIFIENSDDNLKFYVQSQIMQTKTYKNKLKNIFDKNIIIDKKFRQIGEGLGLNQSKDIIISHGGHIYADIIKTSDLYDILEFGFILKIENNFIDYNSAAARALYKPI